MSEFIYEVCDICENPAVSFNVFIRSPDRSDYLCQYCVDCKDSDNNYRDIKFDSLEERQLWQLKQLL